MSLYWWKDIWQKQKQKQHTPSCQRYPPEASKPVISQLAVVPKTIYIKNLDQNSFPNRTVKTFSVATRLFRGILLNIRKSLRWGTLWNFPSGTMWPLAELLKHTDTCPRKVSKICVKLLLLNSTLAKTGPFLIFAQFHSLFSLKSYMFF